MAVTSRGWTGNTYFSSKGVTDQIIGGDHGNVPFYVLYDDGSESLEFEWKMITQKVAIWKYIKEILVPSLLADSNYNSNTNRFIYHEHSVLLGGIRMRLYREKKETNCKHNGVDFDICFSYTQDTQDLTISNIEIPFKTTAENKEVPYIIGFHGIYQGSGNVLILPLNKTESLTILQTLEESGEYLNGAARLLSIDFSLYNPTMNTHTIARVWFEISHSGDIEEHYEINTWEFIRREDTLLITLQMIYAIFVIIWTLIELMECTNDWIHGKKFFHGWNIIDCITLIFYWINIFMEGLQYVNELNTNFTSIDEFESLMYSQFLIQTGNYFLIINGVLLFIRIFKYFTASRRLSYLFELFNKSKLDVFIVFVVIFIIILAFGLAGYLFLSPNVFEFRTIWHSMGNLCTFIVSPMDYKRITENHVVMGAIYYVIWNVIIVLVLSNVFIAILNQGYVEIYLQRDPRKEQDIGIRGMMAKWTKRMMTRKNLSHFSATTADSDDCILDQSAVDHIFEEHRAHKLRKSTLIHDILNLKGSAENINNHAHDEPIKYALTMSGITEIEEDDDHPQSINKDVNDLRKNVENKQMISNEKSHEETDIDVELDMDAKDSDNLDIETNVTAKQKDTENHSSVHDDSSKTATQQQIVSDEKSNAEEDVTVPVAVNIDVKDTDELDIEKIVTGQHDEDVEDYSDYDTDKSSEKQQMVSNEKLTKNEETMNTDGSLENNDSRTSVEKQQQKTSMQNENNE